MRVVSNSEPKLVNRMSLKPGDVFRSGQKVYLVTEGTMNVDLETGEMRPDAAFNIAVEKLNAEVRCD